MEFLRPLSVHETRDPAYIHTQGIRAARATTPVCSLPPVAKDARCICRLPHNRISHSLFSRVTRPHSQVSASQAGAELLQGSRSPPEPLAEPVPQRRQPPRRGREEQGR